MRRLSRLRFEFVSFFFQSSTKIPKDTLFTATYVTRFNDVEKVMKDHKTLRAEATVAIQYLM